MGDIIMFVCEECATNAGGKLFIPVSVGQCELCNKTRDCADMTLPKQVEECTIVEKELTIPCLYNGKVRRKAVVMIMPDDISKFDAISVPIDVNAIAWNNNLDGILYHGHGGGASMHDQVMVWAPSDFCKYNCSILFVTRSKEDARFRAAAKLAKDLPRLR